MSAIRFASAICVLAVVGLMPSSVRSQQTFDDAAAMIQFQRSVDGYAFQHRQVERRLGEGADQNAMAAGMRSVRPSADGDFFTPIVAAAFRTRIAAALRTPGCAIATAGSEVPRVGAVLMTTYEVPRCVSAVLPRLPEELEYRVVSVALILIDTHANMVVDVLHGAFPAP